MISRMEQPIAPSLPRWETSNIYSSLEGEDYRAAVVELQSMLDALESYFDVHEIRRVDATQQPDTTLAITLEEALELVNVWARLSGTLNSFVYALVSTNSYDTLAARELSKLEMLGTRGQKLRVRLQGWIGSLAPRWPQWLAARPKLASHAFFLRDSAHQSRFLMSEELENLAAELVLDAGVAFGKLQGNVTSQLKVPLARDGKTEVLPITVVRNQWFDADAEVRERAYRVELEGWESIRTTVAACLNGVKGTALTLARRRGRPSVLAAALDDNHIDSGTLDAMLSSIRDALPMFRRYLQAKARKLGLPRLRWWDIFAPLGSTHKKFTWAEARDFIVEKFSTFSPDLGQYAAHAFDHRWIDAEPRDGKRGGAFCMEVLGIEESRILANFDGSFEQVSTLAHELGHGYHNHCQKGLAPLLRGAPSTLAETASIFCETLVAESALDVASSTEQLAILETQLCGATQVCLDISSRFQFESAVFEHRAQSELSAEDFSQMMLHAQSDTYAEAVDPNTYHRYMWLWKPHYYAYEHNFYNFPYAFGHLFALGLYAVFRQEGASFVPRYQDLLRATGQEYAAPLAARFGIDITRPEFWRGSLRIIERQLERFEPL
jgi:pepF/M3 family oligoendopeptidase